MRVNFIRRIVADSNHNMDCGAAFFKDALLVTFRQGDSHVSANGKILVIRSRDEGVTFENVATFRGTVDTRDPHLYKIAEDRVHLVAFETIPVVISGTAWSDDGFHWSPYTRYTGADGWWLWHPEYFNGRHYCAGYTWKEGTRDWGAIAWFESDDGLAWRQTQVLREGAECPSECNLVFRPDGTALLLVRRDDGRYRPLLMTSQPPYRRWEAQELDVPIVGLAMWLVGSDVWLAGRWFLDGKNAPGVAHMGVFQLVEGKPQLKMVLPSGPHWDFGYMGVARHPVNSARFALPYYSNHTAPDDPRVDQWSHPSIYLVDAVFDSQFIQDWKVSDVLALPGGLGGAPCPDAANEANLGPWRAMKPMGEAAPDNRGMVDAHAQIAGRAGVMYFVADLELGPVNHGAIHLGYDGPVRVWFNGQEIFAGPGTNPIIPDQTSVPVSFQHGRNRLAIALDTNAGKAWGICARCEVKS